MTAYAAQHLRAECDIDRKGNERERSAAAAEGDAATRKVRIHDTHHRSERREQEQKGHKAEENGACARRAGGVLLFKESHSGCEGSVYSYTRPLIHSYR